MRVLVTGGAGFIGSHLCERLVGDGCDVVCLDNLSTGKELNIVGLYGNPRFDLVVGDVVREMDGTGFEWIFNLASPASPVAYQRDPIGTLKTNVVGMGNVLQLAKKVGARVVQASTSEVYGDPLEHPQREGYWGNVNCYGPRACYDEGKRAAETLCHDYRNLHGVDVRVVRIFNTYGPRMQADDGRVVSNFIVQAMGNEPITIYGDGTQTRSFCYVSDMVDGLVRAMSVSDLVGPTNLGNPEELQIGYLADLILEKVDTRSQVIYEPLPEDDPVRRRPDITKAKEQLNFMPVVGIDEGIEATIDYFKGVMNER
jgi:UDP-glucuronate decarboxylase